MLVGNFKIKHRPPPSSDWEKPPRWIVKHSAAGLMFLLDKLLHDERFYWKHSVHPQNKSLGFKKFCGRPIFFIFIITLGTRLKCFVGEFRSRHIKIMSSVRFYCSRHVMMG